MHFKFPAYVYFPTITERLYRGKVFMIDCVPEQYQRVLHWAWSIGEPRQVITQRYRLNGRLSGFDNSCAAYYVFIIITIESSFRGVSENSLYRANLFHVSFSADVHLLVFIFHIVTSHRQYFFRSNSPAKTTLSGQGYGFCWWRR